jgi:hypothetical protein
MSEGWIKLHRSLIKWEWFSDSKVSHLFLYILLNATHNEYKWKGKIFTKGQMPFGRDKASIETGLSIQNIRTALKKLELTNEITIDSSRQGTVITVVNWDKYQGDSDKPTSKSTDDQPTANQRLTTTKNDKNDNNDKKLLASKKNKVGYSEKLIGLFDECEIVTWLEETGTMKQQDALYSKFEDEDLIRGVSSAYEWQAASRKNNRKASTFLTNWFENSFSKFSVREKFNQDLLIAKLETMGFESEAN